MKKQQGMVLFFSLIVLLIMTVIGVAIAMNSNQSLRMAQTGAERVKAKMALQGALNSVIISNEGQVLATINNVMIIDDGYYQASSTLTPLYQGDVSCARSARPTAGVQCRKIEVMSLLNFGRDNKALMRLVSGIEQEVLAD